MGMNNIYYRFMHLVDNDEYQKLPAKLRMNVIGNPGVDKTEFELYCLAVSAINGCGACVSSHEKIVRKGGISAEGVQSSVRIASVVHGVAVALESIAASAEGRQAA
jgi:alkyl hydroperoxide reductase subunit D